ncbi:hypothetical protein A2926_00705 [Candidatus Giovannonibacteria bacterium RIFCSPLOWO2_01_FULL_44_40]|uniref:Uncharacterized protein n=1 Tax=Candidatus Giovannonibacteria bacterium RIFCSPHIGHO2_01_FULL_45_23 TaxID=1798325 RepID=A0A1F5VEM3_9BACT|nr:MAG: hypothetical protein A2834_00210 [Candidatus Giovannonibacteria bacterium RIFCSPHIGHO2_01_FULL_45_23]OGF76472.1 MAG: hypothetical protein A3C77_02920 [Candidatus Giovannonibacteria bacterium RIFCSPHIGHO2_02_FULL_45_13]OGF79599.1 MAG: hypothetical protein A2926_00705 [Candidatus Giovannonibacteria bacterium RIFCSPLOWO2_01_FULL_44_40]
MFHVVDPITQRTLTGQFIDKLDKEIPELTDEIRHDIVNVFKKVISQKREMAYKPSEGGL